MSDRELLELAAKAVKIDVFFDEDGDCYRIKTSGNRRYWNPLTDDGDALRLTVKLRIDYCVSPNEDSACAWSVVQSDWIEEPFGDDEMAATRRAIVRAAAAIGKSMQ